MSDGLKYMTLNIEASFELSKFKAHCHLLILVQVLQVHLVFHYRKYGK